MVSPQPAPSAAGIRETAPPSPPLSTVPRRIKELKNDSHKPLKARPKEAARKGPHQSLNRRWCERVISDLDIGESFSNHTAIFKILRRIPKLRDHVPRFVGGNASTRTYVREVRLLGLSYKKIQSIKSQLYRSVKLMYDNGVRYNISPQNLYLYGPISWNLTRLLFLRSVTSSELLDVGELDWKEQRDRVCAQIDRIFAPLEIWTFQYEAAELAKKAKEKMDRATSIIGEKNPVIDSAKVELTEKQATLAKAYQRIKVHLTTIEGVVAHAEEMHKSIIRPQIAWEEAHLEKEYADTDMRRANNHIDEANALIQKHGIPKLPKLHDEVVTEDVMSHSDTKLDDNAETKHNHPFLNYNCAAAIHASQGENSSEILWIQMDENGGTRRRSPWICAGNGRSQCHL
ncbi:hypothetical protein GGI35DRAFT_472763 [Trichoderma velutinum]